MLSVRSLFALSLVLLLLTSGKSTASFPLSDGMSASGVYSNAALGFSYTPPRFITNLAASGSGAATGRQAVKFSGQGFAMSRFEKGEPPHIKHAVIYTMVRKDTFITFIFTSNARVKVDKMAESMDTLKLVP